MSENEFNNPDRAESNPVPNEEDIDFIYGEYKNYDYSKNLDSISAKSISLDSMDHGIKLEEMRTPKNIASSNLKMQMMADELAMEMDGQPVIREMSTEYGSSRKREENLMNKDKLDRDEKELIKNRLKAEMSSRPEGFNQKKSLEMYNKLMDEQRAKEARRGFLRVLLLLVIGIASAVMTYFSGIENHADVSKFMGYVPFATVLFSVIMLVPKKAFKVFTMVYFIGNSLILLGPGLLVFALTPANQSGDDFLVKIALFVGATLCSALVCFRLAASSTIDAYYSYRRR